MLSTIKWKLEESTFPSFLRANSKVEVCGNTKNAYFDVDLWEQT